MKQGWSDTLGATCCGEAGVVSSWPLGAKTLLRSSGTKIFVVEETILEECFLARILFFFLAGVGGVDGGTFDVGKR